MYIDPISSHEWFSCFHKFGLHLDICAMDWIKLYIWMGMCIGIYVYPSRFSWAAMYIGIWVDAVKYMLRQHTDCHLEETVIECLSGPRYIATSEKTLCGKLNAYSILDFHSMRRSSILWICSKDQCTWTLLPGCCMLMIWLNMMPQRMMKALSPKRMWWM